jgi:rubredoxin
MSTEALLAPPQEASLRESANDLRVAVRMIELGLEPRTIYSAFDGRLSKRRIQAVFRKMTGRTAKQGVSPLSSDWWSRNQNNRLHASVFLSQAKRLKEANTSLPQLFVDVYESYLQWISLSGEVHLLDADRAYYILVQYQRMERIVIEQCPACDSESAFERWDTLHEKRKCPVCALIGRKAYNESVNPHFVPGNAPGLLGDKPSPLGHEEVVQKTLPMAPHDS